MFCAIGIVSNCKEEEPHNKVHFYVARDKNKVLTLWFGKPFKGIEYWVNVDNSICIAAGNRDFNSYGLNIDDFKNLKWDDKPVEVFLNLEK